MARQLGDFDFKLMGRVKKQSVFLEKGKLCFRTRFFEGTDDKMPIEDYLYEIPLTGIDTDKTELKWNSAWSYGDILVRSREGAEFVRVTTLPSKSSRLKCEKYQHEFEIFGVKNRESLDPLKRLAVLYQEAGVLRSGDGGRETASRDETSPDQTASRPDSFYSIHDFRLNMSWPQVKASVGGTSELKLQKYPEHDDLYVCSLNRSNGNLTFVFHARNQDNLEQSELVCLGLQIDFRSRLSTAEMQNYFNEMIEMKGRPNQVVEGSIPWSLIGGSEVVERGSDDALAAVWGQCEKIGNIDQLEGMDNLQKYCKGKILIQKYSQRDASLMFIDLDRFKRGEGNAGNPVERATEDRDDTVIGEDQVSAGDTSPRSMLIMQAKSYYAMFNMADKNPAMRPSTLDNPMLAMWGGSAENMLKDMIRKCDQYNCPESKRRYEHCLKLCSTWRSNESTLSRPEVRTPATDVGTADVQVEPKAGELRKVDLGNGVSMDFMPIASGSFMMGSENGEDNEKPVHRVTFAQPFWMAKTEVTQAQYQQIMGGIPSHFKGSDLPVKHVSWHDAMSFCKKLTERERQAGRLPEGYEYTLPTEAQWEYACRAGTTGDNAGDLDAMAWYSSNSGDKPHPVAAKRANEWGLFDMHGNVWEWCVDDWHDSYDGAPSDDSRRGDGSGSYRVVRGGSCYDDASICRAAFRSGDGPDGRFGIQGFRPALSSVRSNESALSHTEVRTPATDVGTADVQVEPKAGELRKVDLGNGVSMDFMPIASGSFMMGSENGEDNEKPVHRVTFAQPFWLAKTEVTQAQYQQIMNSNPSEFVGFDLPVETVSWHDAMSFCKKLTERERQAGRLPEGYEYTLPTEAQWEYACRAGTTGDYAGDLDAMAWYYENSGDKRLDDDSWSLVDAAESNSQTHPVGTKRANAWGLYDMHGNVFEWCLDDWHRSYDGAPSDGSQWGDESDSDRVNRGGSWFNGASNCRAASRNWSPMRHECFQGFRPALSSVQGVNRQEER
jgi:formylglycine-generating enzyme required for sulfatase activity